MRKTESAAVTTELQIVRSAPRRQVHSNSRPANIKTITKAKSIMVQRRTKKKVLAAVVHHERPNKYRRRKVIAAVILKSPSNKNRDDRGHDNCEHTEAKVHRVLAYFMTGAFIQVRDIFIYHAHMCILPLGHNLERRLQPTTRRWNRAADTLYQVTWQW